VGLHPQVKHAWLLSSREASPSATTATENLVAEFTARCAPSKVFEILDARMIAERIHENLASERTVRSL
jgi:hypothetical protein